MRKIITLLSVLACLIGCTKDNAGIEGVWYSSTSDGMLYLELRSGGNGVAYFEGCSSTSTFWSVEGKTITIIGRAFNKDFVMYTLGSGTVIGSDIMSIEATISKAYGADKTKGLTFTKK